MNLSTIRSVIIALCIFLSQVSHVGPMSLKANDKRPQTYTGYVSGLEVAVTEDKKVLCTAFVSKGMPAGDDEIQLSTSESTIQSILEHASLRGIRVEVTYYETSDRKNITQVKILDRLSSGKKQNK